MDKKKQINLKKPTFNIRIFAFGCTFFVYYQMNVANKANTGKSDTDSRSGE